MFYKNFINHRKNSPYLVKLKNKSGNIYCKLQIKNMSYVLIDLKKEITL